MGLNLNAIRSGTLKSTPVVKKPEGLPRGIKAASHLLPFCQRLDVVRGDYDKERQRIQRMQTLAYKAADEIARVGEFAGRDRVHRAIKEVLPDRDLQSQVKTWFDVPQVKEELPEYDAAREVLKDFNLTGLSLRVRYCRKSGARIGTLGKSQVRMLAALLGSDDTVCEVYADTALSNAQQILHHNGVSPVWYETSPDVLKRLRSIDPAGYAVYLMASWYRGELIADTVERLAERVEAYRRLSADPDLLAKIAIIEVLAKSSCHVAEKQKHKQLGLGSLCTLPLEQFRAAAAQYVVGLIRRLTKTASNERARLSMSVFYRLQRSQPIPSHLKAIKLGKRTTPEGDTAVAMWALSHGNGDLFDDALDFEMAGAVAHEMTLGDREQALDDELDALERERDWLDDFTNDDTMDALEAIPSITDMVARVQGQERQAGGMANLGLPDEVNAAMSGDVFDDLF